MSIREQDVSGLPVCRGRGFRNRVRLYDVSDSKAPLDACWCERCCSWLSAIPINMRVEGEGVSER